MSVASPAWAEPRGMTLADLAALVVGCAGGMATLKVAGYFQIASFPASARPFLILVQAGMIAGVGLTAVALARRWRYGGTARPTEWMAILAADFLLQRLAPTFGRYVAAWASLSVWDYEPLAWRVAGMATLAAIVAVVLAGILRRWSPGAVTTLLLAAAPAALLWGTAPAVYNFHESLFGPVGRWVEGLAGAQRKGLASDVTMALGRLPQGIVYGLPTVASLLTILRGRSRSWAWSDWASAATGLLVWSAWVGTTHSWGIHSTNEAIVFAVYLAVVGGVTLLIVLRLGPVWNRLFHPGQPEKRTSPAPTED